jgi:hypothetical protein
MQIEPGHDPAAFYASEEDDGYGHSNYGDPFTHAGEPPFIIPRPPPPPPQVQPQQPQSQTPRAQTPFFSPGRNPHYPADPFGFGGTTYPNANASPSPASQHRPTPQPQNPLFMEGYRDILEQLLAPQSQIPQQQPNGIRASSPYPQPQSPSVSGPFYGQGHRLGGTPQPVPQPQPTGARSTAPGPRFHYSVTTYGPDGRVHHMSNHPNQSDFNGRQIPVPSLNEFLGMHQVHPDGSMGRPSEFGDPFNGGPLGLMLRQFMERMVPMQGNRGDYLPYGMSMDDLISHLMEQNAMSNAPPPATNDAMESLPRIKADQKLVDGGKECTVCKEGFSLGESVTPLPCTHVL